MIRVEALTKNYGEREILKPLSFHIKEGEVAAFLGRSGCGKSTLLKLIAGLEPPTSGKIIRASQDIGFVFQDPTLLPWANVEDNIWLPLRLKGVSKQHALPKITEEIERVGLTGFEKTKPEALSGGMKMRVSLARALITKPQLLLLDEPFAALDEITRHELNDVLYSLIQTLKITTLFVTHSLYEAAYLADTTYVLSPRPASIKAILNAPQRGASFRESAPYHAYVASLSSALRDE